MKIIQCEQGDPTWIHERCGRITASRVADVVAKLKNGKPGASRHTYMMEKLTEVLTGQLAEHFVTNAMQWGIETEGMARTNYELANGVDVQRVGMVVHGKIERSSCSPDGLIGQDGALEIKCPTTATHLEYLIDGVMPEEYIPQCMWTLACTGRSYVDFVSYDPRLPQDFSLFVKRLPRDEKLIAAMEFEVVQFIEELNAMCEKLLKNKRAAGPGPEVAALPDVTEWIGRT